MHNQGYEISQLEESYPHHVLSDNTKYPKERDSSRSGSFITSMDCCLLCGGGGGGCGGGGRGENHLMKAPDHAKFRNKGFYMLALNFTTIYIWNQSTWPKIC